MGEVVMKLEIIGEVRVTPEDTISNKKERKSSFVSVLFQDRFE